MYAIIFLKCIFISVLYHVHLVTSSTHLETTIASINKEGFSDTLLYDVLKSNNKIVSDKELVKELKSESVQNALIAAALKYATKNVDNKKEMLDARSSWSDYCSYSWVRWISFMDCDNYTSSGSTTVEVDREEHQGFQVIKDNGGKCYQSHTDH